MKLFWHSQIHKNIKEKLFFRNTFCFSLLLSSHLKPSVSFNERLDVQKLWHIFIGISGSLIWSKTLIKLILNPCGEFRWSPEDPVSQDHSPHLLVGATGIFSDLFRSVQMLNRKWGAETTGINRTYSSLVKLQPWLLSLRWKTSLWAELQPWCLSLQWKTFPWAE